jgi:SnoaL-like domain
LITSVAERTSDAAAQRFILKTTLIVLDEFETSLLRSLLMPFPLRRPALITALALLSAISGFACGWIAKKHMRVSLPEEVRKQYLQQPGDAPLEVRSGVVLALRELQEGYRERDANGIDMFMSRLFAKNADVLILGTDGGEWERGYSQAADFINSDWKYWGDVRFATDDAVISSSGNVAWISTVGDVNWKGTSRALRLSAVLVRSGDHWLFRELQFQWDENDLPLKDLLRLQPDSRR